MIRQLRDYGLNGYALKEIVGGSALGRFAYGRLQFAKARRAAGNNDTYAWARAICQALRLLEGGELPPGLEAQRRAVLAAAGAGELLRSFVTSDTARSLRQQYEKFGEPYATQMKFPRDNDDPRRQGNLVVLKAPDVATGEKGVLYLQYTESIASFVALFDLAEVGRRYRLVLEPSTWGYQDESYLLLLGAGVEVVVQAQDEPDFNYIRALDSNLSALRLGAGDWVDPERFVARAAESKQNDFVMVASWSPMKRHALLFRSLQAAGLQRARLALVGYPIDGRTQSDIARMARKHGLTDVSIFENIPHAAVAEIVANSRAGIMLSLREGANRGIYECLFSDVPVVLTRENRGVNKQHINSSTGRLASDHELPSVLRAVLEQSGSFTPRAWAVQHTGKNVAYEVLQARIADLATQAGEPYERPIARIKSAPYTVYAQDSERLQLADQYEKLAALRRP